MCSRCSPEVILDPTKGQHVLCHHGGHILEDPNVDRTAEPCGLCQQPWPMCEFYLKKGKGANRNLKIDLQASRGCINLHLIKFTYGVATKSTASSPCSNVPIICPLCSKSDPAIWRYNMLYHFKRQHPLANLTEYHHLWLLSNFEKVQMKEVWRNRHKAGVKRRTKKTLPPLILSEAHSSTLAFRYVLLLSKQHSYIGSLT